VKIRFAGSLFVTAFVLLLGIAYLGTALSSEMSGCIKCHTDEQILKSLYKPPKIDSSEGEG